MAHLTTKQIKQLIEIDEAGSGIRAEVQTLIKRLTSGGVGIKTDDPRKAQAKRLWDKGFNIIGDGVKDPVSGCLRFPVAENFEQYLATIPQIPEALMAADERFPLLILVDARHGITESCKFAGLKYNGDDRTFEDFDPKKVRTSQVYWMHCQDGRKNRGKSVKTCRENFAKDEIGLTAMEGVALYIQNSKVIKGHFLDLAGSVHRESHDYVASLGDWRDEPGLVWSWHGGADPFCGAASRLE